MTHFSCLVKTANRTDNCPGIANKDQLNSDNDSYGDVCDCDEDNDGVLEKCKGTDTDGDGVPEHSTCSIAK